MLERINLEKIPQELREVAQWVVWKTVHRGKELTKIPFQLNGQAASSTNPETWAQFDDVAVGLQGSLQPGFVFSVEDPFCGIDLDGCRNPETGEVSAWAKTIIVSLNSYAEVSPSRTGVKVFVKAAIQQSRKWNVNETPVCEKKPGIEVYDRERYFAVTGWKLAGVPSTVNESQSAVDSLLELQPKKPKARATVPTEATERDVVERAANYVARMPAAVSGARGHDATFKVACVLVLGFGLSQSDAMGLMLDFNQRCDPPWSDRELIHKLESAESQGGDRNYLRHAQRDEIYSVKVPKYSETPSVDEQKPTAEPVRATNLRDAAIAYLETIKGGGNSLVETGLPSLDYAIGGGVEFGEMFIMAARPSHGKSAIALQAVHHWTDIGLPCLFVSEEMSALALGKRSVQFATDIHQEHWTTNIDRIQFDLSEHFAKRAPCHVVESCRTTTRLVEAVDNAVATQGVRCVVVDYAQLLGSSGKSRYEQVTNVSVTLRQLASKHNIVLLVLCQLSRGIESRDSFVPRVSDLKETGQLEQDADVIVFNVWPNKVDSTQPPGRYQFFICKNRNRAINVPVVDCRFEPSRQRFLEEVAGSERREVDYANADSFR